MARRRSSPRVATLPAFAAACNAVLRVAVSSVFLEKTTPERTCDFGAKLVLRQINTRIFK